MAKQTHYPTYDVMSRREDWDEHTRSIVTSRLFREHMYEYLELPEAEVLRVVCAHLAGDDRGEIIQYVLCHIDETLAKGTGEGQRKRNAPEEQRLISGGLKALDMTAIQSHTRPFYKLGEEEQRMMMTLLSEARLEPKELWRDIPQKVFFQKLLSFTVEAYYSHPAVWSEIGYGGPAYPRGYIRTGVGQLDPWEAKKQR